MEYGLGRNSVTQFSDAKFVTNFYEWERDALEYEKLVGIRLADYVMCATFVKAQPAKIESVLSFAPLDHQTDYKKLQEMLRLYLTRSITFDQK